MGCLNIWRYCITILRQWPRFPTSQLLWLLFNKANGMWKPIRRVRLWRDWFQLYWLLAKESRLAQRLLALRSLRAAGHARHNTYAFLSTNKMMMRVGAIISRRWTEAIVKYLIFSTILTEEERKITKSIVGNNRPPSLTIYILHFVRGANSSHWRFFAWSTRLARRNYLRLRPAVVPGSSMQLTISISSFADLLAFYGQQVLMASNCSSAGSWAEPKTHCRHGL